ncbi:MAG: hypothetical protein AB7C97_03325 [Oscillospiraceae bacterium]
MDNNVEVASVNGINDGEYSKIYKSKYVPFIVKWGRRTNLLGALLLFIPCIVVTALGYQPLWGAVGLALVMRFSSLGLNYVIEPVSYYPGLGLAGTYMAFLDGNINNMRLPCAIVAQDAVGAENGTPKGNCIATIGVAVSVFVNLIVLSITIIFGTAIINALSPDVKSSLNYLLPALFGSLLASITIKKPILACISLPLALFMTIGNKTFSMLSFLPTMTRTPVVMLVSIFGSVALGLIFLQKKNQAK